MSERVWWENDKESGRAMSECESVCVRERERARECESEKKPFKKLEMSASWGMLVSE